ncbi:helix-turn-helix domain-containing protein [Corynebacterium curieae]|uniref:Helix-turn-helix domain-containing protein n=1 Tax=Corynebacterium curieae TaxID=2913500 RepID=A0ABU3W6B9_9CORY|nr:helix-turn-helix domain-containing protein [Corynebacterium curieae]MDV2423609.1 helix-turn-helix domain-containing protein [Corynebacterium curieae]
MPDSLPRPTTELFPEALNLSPKQREVLTALQRHPDGAKASTVAKELGMHVNTARGHIDELVNAGAVNVVSAPSKGRGRPSLIFQVRVPDNKKIAEEYITLVEVLTTMLAEKDALDDDASARAIAIGRRWARATGTGESEGALGTLFSALRDMGFDPATRPDSADIDLQACPFVSSGLTPSPFLCAIHAGFLQETSDEDTTNNLVPRQHHNVCRLEIKPA